MHRSDYCMASMFRDLFLFRSILMLNTFVLFTAVVAVVIDALIALAHSLRLSLIAERIESADQVMFLLQRNCDELQ